MDVKAFPALIVGVVVALVLAGAVLPVFAETTSATDTFKNEGYYNMIKLDNTSECTIVWDTATPNIITVDGRAIEIEQLSTMRLTILGSDTICVRCISTQIQVIGSLNGTQKTHSLTANGSSVMTITVSSGIVSSSINDVEPKTFDLGNDAYVLAPKDVESDYVAVMKIGNINAYVLGESEIICCGVSISTNLSNAIGVFGKGNVKDGVTFSSFYTGTNYSGDTTIDNVEIYDEELSNYENLYSLEKITLDIDYNVDQTSNATYSYFIVPSEVTAEKSVHPDGPLTVLLNVLPLLAIAGLVTGAVVWFINRKG